MYITFIHKYLFYRKKPVRIDIPKNAKLRFNAFAKQQRMPFTCYVDTEAMLIPQDQFDKHKNEEEEKEEEDLGLEALHDYFGFIHEEDADESSNYSPDSDFEYEDDNQEIPTRRCSSKRIQNKKAKEEEEKRKEEEEQIQLDQLHPWSDKRLKITSSQDVEMVRHFV